MKRIVSIALALCLCVCLAAPALADGADKAETVYIEADAEGNVRDVTVETVLHYGGDGKTVEDRSELTDIKNTEGDEEFTQGADGALLWEDHGEAIRYEGRTDKALPVAVHVSYYLDGARILPEKLAGKSGHVRIRFDYENNTSETVTVSHPAGDDDSEPETEEVETCIPLMAISLVMLGDTFQNVEVENGRLMALGDESVVFGYALPGLAEYLSVGDYELTEDVDIPGYVQIDADVTDFSLDFTATIVSNGLFKELEPEDLDDLDEMSDGMGELAEASEKLADATRRLADGAEEFSDHIAQYADGAGQLSDGAQALSGGLAAVVGKKDDLLDGASGLQTALEALDAAASGLTAPDTDEASAALGSILADISALSGTLTQLRGELADLAAYTGDVDSAVSAARGSLAGIDLDLSAAIGGLELTDEQKQRVADAVAGVIRTAEGEIAAARSHLDDVPAAPAAPDLAACADTLSGLASDIAAQAGTLQTAAAALGAAAALPETLKAALSRLAGGSKQLTEGLTALMDGLVTLSDGASALSSGAKTLAESGNALRTAASELADGTGELADGMKEFDEEGISELSDLADDSLAALVTELRALREADLAYDNFGGIADGRTGSVRFIIETDGIE